MKKVDLTKYGFIRWPEKDFYDDGSTFTCYRAGKAVRVSKLVAGGQAYLSCSSEIGNRSLPYEVYSKLPHYNDATWKYNEVPVESLTKQDLIDFYNACVAYEKEYEEAESTIQYPTIEELTVRCAELRAKAMAEYTAAQKIVINTILCDKFGELSHFQVTEVKNDLFHLQKITNSFDPKTYPQSIYKSAYSFEIIAPDFPALVKESYWLTDLKQILKEY